MAITLTVLAGSMSRCPALVEQIRVSSVARWAACERYALESINEMDEPSIAASSWVGTLAHGKLAKQKVDHPPAVRWDATTPSYLEAEAQSSLIAEVASERLRHRRWSILDAETELANADWLGHADLIVESDTTGELGIVDLKTGVVGAGWLQVGGYLSLCEEMLMKPSFGAILHAPRARVGKDVVASLEARNGARLRHSFLRLERRIKQVLIDLDYPTETPGTQCRFCLVNSCPVRSVRNPELQDGDSD